MMEIVLISFAIAWVGFSTFVNARLCDKLAGARRRISGQQAVIEQYRHDMERLEAQIRLYKLALSNYQSPDADEEEFDPNYQIMGLRMKFGTVQCTVPGQASTQSKANSVQAALAQAALDKWANRLYGSLNQTGVNILKGKGSQTP
jgi:hypothetical protein